MFSMSVFIKTNCAERDIITLSFIECAAPAPNSPIWTFVRVQFMWGSSVLCGSVISDRLGRVFWTFVPVLGGTKIRLLGCGQ